MDHRSVVFESGWFGSNGSTSFSSSSYSSSSSVIAVSGLRYLSYISSSIPSEYILPLTADSGTPMVNI
eukprot:UN07639